MGFEAVGIRWRLINAREAHFESIRSLDFFKVFVCSFFKFSLPGRIIAFLNSCAIFNEPYNSQK